MRNRSLVRHVAVKDRIHYDGAAGIGQHFAAQANDAAAGHAKLHAHAAGAVIVHLGHLALARSQLFDELVGHLHRVLHVNKKHPLFDDHTGVRIGHVDGQTLHWLHHHAVDTLGNDLRPTNHQLKTFAAHHLNQNGQLQFAAAQHLEAIRGFCFFNEDADIGQQLLLQPLTQIAAGHPLALAPGER